MDTGIPFNPLREELYVADELYDAFVLNDPESFSRCSDVAIYRRSKLFGTNPVAKDSETTLQALHDNSISRLVMTYTQSSRRIVAIMGGHDMERGSDEYTRVASLARVMTRAGILVASGGGPGAMEAAHLGAFLSDAPDGSIDAAVKELAVQKSLPSNASRLVRNNGTIDPQVAGDLHAYLAPAMRLRGVYTGGKLGESLAVPTWLYGHEPSTPFASHIAKYFQNSIREDGLVTIGATGIVFTEGRAGTIQEIFQDAAQNYYQTTGEFCKMVFLSSRGKAYWEKTYPVRPLIEALLASRPGASGKILFTEDSDEAAQFLLA
jgi:predicted Rossmann-fold nucleotide-binding protein